MYHHSTRVHIRLTEDEKEREKIRREIGKVPKQMSLPEPLRDPLVKKSERNVASHRTLSSVPIGDVERKIKRFQYLDMREKGPGRERRGDFLRECKRSEYNGLRGVAWDGETEIMKRHRWTKQLAGKTFEDPKKSKKGPLKNPHMMMGMGGMILLVGLLGLYLYYQSHSS